MFDKTSDNKRIKNIIKAVIIILVFALTFCVLDQVLLLKSEDGIEQMQAYYKQPDGTVDALFVGSSHIFCHVNTGVLWDKYGISGYDLAGAEQPYWNSYYYIKEALKTQTPKVIVLDISTPGIRPIDFQPENWLITNIYGMKWSKNRYDALKVSAIDQSFFRLLIPTNSTHGRYSSLTELDFTNNHDSAEYKGFDPREATREFETPDVSNVTERGELSDKENEYLRILIEYVQGKNIPLLFITSPYVVSEKEQAKYNTIYDIADEYGVPYIDYNMLYDEMGLDFKKDLAEELHLNRSGNEKFTTLLGQHLKERYDLSDHRGDSRYSSWDTDALCQRQDTLLYNIRCAVEDNNSEEFLKLIDNKNLVIFLSIPADYEGLSDGSLLPYLEKLGLNIERFKSNGAFILNSGSCIYESYEPEFKAAINDGNRRLVFYRKLHDDSGHVMTSVRINGTSGYQKISGYETISLPQDGLSFFVYDTATDKASDVYTIN